MVLLGCLEIRAALERLEVKVIRELAVRQAHQGCPEYQGLSVNPENGVPLDLLDQPDPRELQAWMELRDSMDQVEQLETRV